MEKGLTLKSPQSVKKGGYGDRRGTSRCVSLKGEKKDHGEMITPSYEKASVNKYTLSIASPYHLRVLNSFLAASAGGRGLSDDGQKSELAPHYTRPKARAAVGILKKSALVARQNFRLTGAST